MTETLVICALCIAVCGAPERESTSQTLLQHSCWLLQSSPHSSITILWCEVEWWRAPVWYCYLALVGNLIPGYMIAVTLFKNSLFCTQTTYLSIECFHLCFLFLNRKTIKRALWVLTLVLWVENWWIHIQIEHGFDDKDNKVICKQQVLKKKAVVRFGWIFWLVYFIVVKQIRFMSNEMSFSVHAVLEKMYFCENDNNNNKRVHATFCS